MKQKHGLLSICRATTNTYRLMVIGDSYVAALSCPLETTFHRQLESELNRRDPFARGTYEVIACGRGNQAQAEKGRYVTDLGSIYKPDAILLLFFCGNDVMEDSPETFLQAARFGIRYKRLVTPRKIALFNRLRAATPPSSNRCTR